MANILAVYGTTYGHTARVVDRVAGTLRTAGHHVTVFRADTLPPGTSIDMFDGYLVAGSVLRGRYQKYLGEFVRTHLPRLNTAPSAFLSVQGTPEDRRSLETFLAKTAWQPNRAITIGGELAYTRYGFVLRWIMRLISLRHRRPTDTSRDWVLTDWVVLDRFAAHLARAFERDPAGTGARAGG